MGKSKYSCQCIKCGFKRTYYQQALDNGNTLCGCTKSGVKKGDTYFRLTAKERDLSRAGTGRVYWLWECECGNVISAPLKDVKSGNTKSCGCRMKEAQKENCLKGILKATEEDLSDKTFGQLYVIRQATPEEVINRPSGIRYWLCQCDCGNKHIVGTNDLKRGKVSSCGCLLSKGEAKIKQILTQNKISFCPQFSFSDLSNDNHYYRFDFAIFEDKKLAYLIEYDGVQHYDVEKQFNNDGESWNKIHKRDLLKNEYCQKNNIPLIRIPYWKLNTLNINDLKLETTSYLLKGDDE